MNEHEATARVFLSLIPVLLSLVFWSFVGAIVLVPLLIKQRAQRQAHETLRAMIAQGREASPETILALQGPDKSPTTPAGLRTRNAGYVVVALGAGFLVFAAALATALWANQLYTGASIAGAVIAGVGLAIAIIGGSLILVGKRTLQQFS